MKYKVTLNQKVYEVEVERGEALLLNVSDAVATPQAVQSAAPAPTAAPTIAGAGEVVASPMPGVVLSVNVAVNDRVTKGQLLLVIEAMKMENDITALRDGVITSVLVSKGSAVETGTPLVTIA